VINVLDVHKGSVFVVQADDSGNETNHLRLRANYEVMNRFLDGLPAGSTVIMESCYAWEYIYDLAVEKALNAIVVNTGELYPKGKPEKKNDLEDCRRILRLHKIGELPTIQPLNAVERDLRDLLRLRIFETRKITAFRNRTHFTVDRLGLRFPTAEIFGARKFDPQDLPISRANMVQLASNQRILEVLEAQEKALEAEITARIVGTKDIKNILTINGIGIMTAATMTLEMGSVKRFVTKEKLTAYAGLVPAQDSSDEEERTTRIRKRCNHYLKWAAIEAARHCIQYDPSMKERYLRLLHCPEHMATKSRKGKAVVAVARHLLEVIWCMLSRNEPYRGAPAVNMSKKFEVISRKAKQYVLPEPKEIFEGVSNTLEKPTDLSFSPDGEWEGCWEQRDALQSSREEARAGSKTTITPASIFI
jgi:transposase